MAVAFRGEQVDYYDAESALFLCIQHGGCGVAQVYMMLSLAETVGKHVIVAW